MCIFIKSRTGLQGIRKGKTMSKFENKLCPVCRKRFGSEDDIAVCPVCGTPHHRACYLSANKCALEEFHAGGFSWNGRLPDEPMPVPNISELPGSSQKKLDENDEKTLTLLGITDLKGDDLEEFLRLKEDGAMHDLLQTIQDEAKGDDGVSMQELIAYTGTSVWHYSKVFNSFRGMTEDGKKHILSFNLCSGLFAPIYQFYRKMDLLGIAALIFYVLPSALSLFLIWKKGAVMQSDLMTFNFLFKILPLALLCVFGDYLFYKKAVKKIRKIRGRFEGKTRSIEYLQALSDCGRPSFARALIGALAALFAEACIMALSAGLQ